MITLSLLEIEQPIGTFYFGKIKMSDLKQIAEIHRRDANNGTQRQLKDKKVDDIAYYCKDPDAIFPTPIIISITSEKTLHPMGDGIYEITLDENNKAEIIDGQHRFEGIKCSNLKDIYLPIVVMFNLNDSEKAYIFSTINNNQAKVDKSLIYDLFGVAKERSPYKTCHEIARMLNTDPESPYCGKIKMLEKRQSEDETLSQGTFVTHLLKLITSNANKDTVDSKNDENLNDNQNFVFRKYYIDEKDAVIAKILINYFQAAKDVFIQEWVDDSYILTKTTGYSALIRALKILVPYGEQIGDLSKDLFKQIFVKVKTVLSNENKTLTSEFFPSGGVGEKALADYITKAIND